MSTTTPGTEKPVEELSNRALKAKALGAENTREDRRARRGDARA
jgi:hypothetical protein